MFGIADIIFANPWFLLLLPAVILLWYLRQRKKYHAEVLLSSTMGFEGVKTLKTRLRPLLNVLQLTAITALIIALARPQSVLKKDNISGEGIDIILAMDVSTSMLAKDFEEDRLDASRRVAISFVEKRKNDRIGIVVFGGESFTQCPLTTDHGIVKEFLSKLQCGLIADGTAIGMGLANAVRRLQKSEAKSKVVILLTDGVNNTGYVSPQQAAEAAKKYAVKVYTVGVGTMGKAKAPIARKSNGGFVFGFVDVEIDEALMTKIAESSGGQYFRATDMQSLENVYAQIDKMERTKIDKNTLVRYREEFHWFVLISILSILSYLVLSNTVFRTIVQ
jgi:Ca-activated chloride channel family protein